MKVNALEAFRNMLAILNDPSFMRQLSAFVQRIEGMRDITSILNECRQEGDIYIYYLEPYSLYFSIIEDEWYFVDMINPTKLRTGIGSRNPIYNHSINPIYNHSINPIYNHSINPIFNHSINPAYNHTIHPAYNHSINPYYNKNIEGFYAYNQSTKHLDYFAILVPNHLNIMTIYTYSDCKVAYYAVRRGTGFCVFNFSTNSYEGYLESHKNEGYNWFDTNNKWIMYLV